MRVITKKEYRMSYIYCAVPSALFQSDTCDSLLSIHHIPRAEVFLPIFRFGQIQ